MERTVILSPGTSGNTRDIFGPHSWAGELQAEPGDAVPTLGVQDVPTAENGDSSLEYSLAESRPSCSLICSLASLVLSLLMAPSPSSYPMGLASVKGHQPLLRLT